MAVSKRNERGQFVKGLIPWNKGVPHSVEAKRKMSEASKGRPSANKGKTGVRFNTGRTHFKKGNTGELCPNWKGGKPKCPVCNKTLAAYTSKFCKTHTPNRGQQHYNWMGGVTPMNEKIRKSLEYKNWRSNVFERDNFTCISCNKHGGELHADHIKPFAYYPELRFEVSNGRTLCVSCHRQTSTYGTNVKHYMEVLQNGH